MSNYKIVRRPPGLYDTIDKRTGKVTGTDGSRHKATLWKDSLDRKDSAESSQGSTDQYKRDSIGRFDENPPVL